MRLPARKRLKSNWELSSSGGKLMSAAQAADCACWLTVKPPDAEEEERFVVNLSSAPKSFWLCLVLLFSSARVSSHILYDFGFGGPTAKQTTLPPITCDVLYVAMT